MLGSYGDWLTAGGKSDETRRLREHYVRRWLDHIGDPLSATLDDLLSFLACAHWSPETRKSARASLRTFYAYLLATGQVDRDPTAGLPPVRVPAGRPRPTPAQVVDRALSLASDEELLMLGLAGWMGLRRSEIARVNSRDFDGLRLRVSGKGGKVRVIPVHPRVLPLLAEVDGWAFPSPVRRGDHVGPDYVGKHLARLLGDGWTAHTLRHRFATEAYRHSHDLMAVRDLLGHASPTTTSRYTQIDENSLSAAVLSIA